MGGCSILCPWPLRNFPRPAKIRYVAAPREPSTVENDCLLNVTSRKARPRKMVGNRFASVIARLGERRFRAGTTVCSHNLDAG